MTTHPCLSKHLGTFLSLLYVVVSSTSTRVFPMSHSHTLLERSPVFLNHPRGFSDSRYEDSSSSNDLLTSSSVHERFLTAQNYAHAAVPWLILSSNRDLHDHYIAAATTPIFTDRMRIHSLCSHDVSNLCNGNTLYNVAAPSTNPSLGYSCQKVERCLWNAFEHHALSQPCNQAILDLVSLSNYQTANDRHNRSFFSTICINQLQQVLSLLQSYPSWVSRMTALLFSTMILSLAFLPRRYRRRFFCFYLYPHSHTRLCNTNTHTTALLQAIQSDTQLLQHVQRVIGESVDIKMILSQSRRYHRRRHRPILLHQVATDLLSKTTLIALILFFAWTYPLFMTVFLGFHLFGIMIVYMVGLLINGMCHAPSKDIYELEDDDDDEDAKRDQEDYDEEDGSYSNSLWVREQGQQEPVFVGVALKIV